MLGILEQPYRESRDGLDQQQEQLIERLKESAEKAAFRIVVEEAKQKEYMLMLAEKVSLVLEEQMKNALDLIEAKNQAVVNSLCLGDLQIEHREISPLLSRMGSSKAIQSETISRLHSYDQSQELKRALFAKELVKRKQEEKLQRQRRLESILLKEAQASRLKQQEQKKQRESAVWARTQQSLEGYRVTKERYSQQRSQNQSKLESIRQFQHKITSICRHSERSLDATDSKANKELQTSRTETLTQRRNQFKLDYRQLEEHNQKYMEKLKSLEADRLSRLSQRRSADLNAIKLIKPFKETYVSKDNSEQLKERVHKVKEFKEHVRLHLKPKIDPEKRSQIVRKIVNQDSNRYRSLGVVREEVGGTIVEKQLPKINLRSIGNEYMKYAKKLKARHQHQTESLQQEPSQRPVLTDYLKDLKRQQRKRLSRCEQIERSEAGPKEKVKRIQIAIQCLQSEIKKHRTLMRNSGGLPSDRVQQLREAVDSKYAQIANLKLTMVSLLDEC